MPDELVDERRKQYLRRVPSMAPFNGATCLVCVDVWAIGTSVGNSWAWSHPKNPTKPPPTDADIVAAVLAAIQAEAAKCPAGSNIKLQLMYHSDPKKVWGLGANGKPEQREWNIQQCVQDTLKKLPQLTPPLSVQKIYLTACGSTHHNDVIDEAMKVPGVTHVVTASDTIGLKCGTIEGLAWHGDQPTFQPQGFDVTVWVHENGKQIGLTSPVDKDKKIDIPSNSLKDRRCPTRELMTGSDTVVIGYWNTAAEATAYGDGMLPSIAMQEAKRKLLSFKCPCPDCPAKRIESVTYAGSEVSASWSILASVVNWRTRYKVFIECEWQATVVCE